MDRVGGRRSRQPVLVVFDEEVDDDVDHLLLHAGGASTLDLHCGRARADKVPCSAIAGSAFAIGTASLIEDLGCSRELAVLGLSAFPLGFGLAPLLLAPFSE